MHTPQRMSLGELPLGEVDQTCTAISPAVLTKAPGICNFFQSEKRQEGQSLEEGNSGLHCVMCASPLRGERVLEMDRGDGCITL